jgi:hypothetical protein
MEIIDTCSLWVAFLGNCCSDGNHWSLLIKEFTTLLLRNSLAYVSWNMNLLCFSEARLINMDRTRNNIMQPAV